MERPFRGSHKVLMEPKKMVDGDSVHAAYQMTPATFDELLEIVGPHSEMKATTSRDPVGAVRNDTKALFKLCRLLATTTQRL